MYVCVFSDLLCYSSNRVSVLTFVSEFNGVYVCVSTSSSLLQTDSVANHPNQWFQVSMSYHLIKSGKLPASSPPSTSSSAMLPGSSEFGSGELGSPEPNPNPTVPSMDAMEEATEG